MFSFFSKQGGDSNYWDPEILSPCSVFSPTTEIRKSFFHNQPSWLLRSAVGSRNQNDGFLSPSSILGFWINSKVEIYWTWGLKWEVSWGQPRCFMSGRLEICLEEAKLQGPRLTPSSCVGYGMDCMGYVWWLKTLLPCHRALMRFGNVTANLWKVVTVVQLLVTLCHQGPQVGNLQNLQHLSFCWSNRRWHDKLTSEETKRQKDKRQKDKKTKRQKGKKTRN